MALEERTRLYEILVRFERDKSGDRIRGMHLQTITEIVRDGEVVVAYLNPAQPVDLRDLLERLHPTDHLLLTGTLHDVENEVK